MWMEDESQRSGERTGHTLGTTGLVHEAYLGLVDQTRLEYRDRAHFYGIAARAMRHILVDYARRHGPPNAEETSVPSLWTRPSWPSRIAQTPWWHSTRRWASWRRWTRGSGKSYSAVSSVGSRRRRPAKYSA
jgi:hypothetical protein